MKILNDGTVEKTKFDVAVENLIEVCGFDKSESGSEEFVNLLQGILEDIDYRIYRSHKDGLCWDACHDLADELQQATEGCVCEDCGGLKLPETPETEAVN